MRSTTAHSTSGRPMTSIPAGPGDCDAGRPHLLLGGELSEGVNLTSVTIFIAGCVVVCAVGLVLMTMTTQWCLVVP